MPLYNPPPIAAMFATHTAIATAHQDAPDLIATHTAIDTAHQDAPDLIATHTAIADAHHTPGASPLVITETEVFSGDSPASWTDLDLSGEVGSNPALVLLKINGATANDYYAVRKKGDTDEFWTATELMSGCALIKSEVTSIHYVVLVATDNSGVIQWRSQIPHATTIDLIGYII